MKFLALDKAGNPFSWLDHEAAIQLLTTDRILAPLGAETRVFQGGINARTGQRSRVEVPSILLTRARVQAHLWQRDYEPPVSNRALFARDDHLCLYCGEPFPLHLLTRDHLLPRCRGGTDRWQNLVTACRSCNQRKGARTPQEWGVQLLAVPYVPCHAEHLLLANRSVLADQMAFLHARMRNRDRVRRKD